MLSVSTEQVGCPTVRDTVVIMTEDYATTTPGRGLAAGALVSPSCMSDRYVFYRVPELLQSYLDHTAPAEDAQLPYQRADFKRYFPNAKISAVVAGDVRGEERLKSAEERNVRAYKVSECCLLSISLIF